MKSKFTSIIILIILASGYAFSQITQTFSSTGTFIPPAGITSVNIAAWGGGGGGAGASTVTTAGGGGGGGAFAQNTALTVVPGTSYIVIVGGGGPGGTSLGTNGENGVASTFDASQVVAAGGLGGGGSTSATPGIAGSGGTSGSSTGPIKFSGGNGAAGVLASGGGGGGGSAGSTGTGGNGGTPTAGTAGTGAATFTGAAGGAGGNNTTGSNGTAGNSPGAGGGGGLRGSDNMDRAGGNGANGLVKITYTCPTYSLTSTTGTAYSTYNGSAITLTSAAANLPVGKYIVTYNFSGANTGVGLTSFMTISGAGSGTFLTSQLNLTGSTTVTITNISSGSPTSCSSNIAANNTVSVASNDKIGISGGNWTNNSNWTTDSVTSPSAPPTAVNQVRISTGTVILNEPTGIITIGSLRGSATIRASVATTFTIGALNLNSTFSGNIINNASNIDIVKTGTGTLTLSGTNSYVGLTTVNNGTLSLASSSALGATTTTTVNANGTLDIKGVTINKNITINGTGINSVGSLTGTGTSTLTGNITLGSNSAVGGTGTLTISGIISGANRLEKAGTGTTILSGANTFSNGTKISSGTLALGAAGVLDNLAAVELAGGTFSSGVTTGFSEAMGNISISSSSTLALGTGIHSLNFSGKGSFSTDKVMTITGWTGGYNGSTGSAGKVFIGTSAFLSAAELAQIWFFDGTRTFPATQLTTGEVVPIGSPCPSVPVAPSTSANTLPACADLTPLSSGSVANNTKYGVSGLGSCSNTTVTLSSDLQNGNVSTNIYVKTGETLIINGNINASFIGNIFVMPGGTLNLSGDINGGSVFNYGTFNHAVAGLARNQGSPSKVYVAYGAVYNAGSSGGSYQQNSGGTLIIEGAVNVTNLDQFQASALTCINTSGCFNFSAVNSVNTTQSPTTGFQSGTAGGVLYYLPNSCPSTNANFSNSANLNICAPNIPAGSVPCSRFGGAKVFYGAACNPTTSNCAGVVALPVTLVYFKAKITSEGVVTSWATKAQWNSDYFVIERSKDGVNWEYVGTVKSSNDPGKYKQFSLGDEDPYQGGSYYKLVEVSIDGKKTSYSVLYVQLDFSEFDLFSVYPNPSTGDLNVRIKGDETGYDFVLIDMPGRIIYSQKLTPGLNSLRTVLTTPGVYIARLKIRREYKLLKVVIQ